MIDTVLLNNRYSLEKPLGSGGMAVVYRAHDQMLERTVAIKLLREDYSRDPEFKERFHQEAKAAANLVHPNIVTVHDFGIDAGRIYIVMEYVPGTNLNALLQNRGRMAVPEALLLIQQACAGIGYAHRAGLVHCDVKPHNFLITPDNRLKVTDFGIARAMETVHTEERADVVWGSPQYFSPEQAAGKPPSPASDVYSLGIVLFYMLTGRLPFTAATAAETARLHRTAPPPSPRQFNPVISTALEEVILKVLAKEPSQRYRTADQLGRVLMGLEETRQPAPLFIAPVSPVLDKTEANRQTLPPDVTSAHPPKPDQETQPSLSNHAPEPARQHPSAMAGQPARAGNSASNSSPIPYSRPVSSPLANHTSQLISSPAVESPAQNPLDIDWITIGLGLAALIAVGGLIPLWVWVYISFTQQLP